MISLREYLQKAALDTEQAMDRLVPLRQTSPEAPLYFAMRYSLFAGGKRLRPALFYAALECFGLTRENYVPFAVGLEMIHTYSLIHDDLPAMDDDDLRRGKPTCHKVYGEAMAILAGDALLTHAFFLMLRPIPGVDASRQLAAVREVALLAGIGGMVAGQAAEMEAAGGEMDQGLLDYINQGKTSGLFAAAVLSAAHLAGASEAEREALRKYARQLGLAFQITDDILDVQGDEALLGKPVGSDAKNKKNTYASLYGCDEAKVCARKAADAAIAALEAWDAKGDMLRAFPEMFVKRAK